MNTLTAIIESIQAKGIRFSLTFRFWGTPKMSNFKYFTDEEVAGLQDNLPAMLDQARGIAGVPFRLTATVATDGHSPNSTHYKGLAVDIGLGHLLEGPERDAVRWATLKGLFSAGFQRVEVCPLHIHVDIGTLPDYVTPICWIGTDS